MIRNYIKVAFRSLAKNKVMFSINVIGLAIGIATCLIIALFVADELSYDAYNTKADRIVRVNLDGKMGNEIIHESNVMPPVAATLKAELPGVEDATRIGKVYTDVKVNINKQILNKGTLAFVDPNFFDIFTLPLLKGNAETALTKPNTVILTEKQAKMYFGEEDPLGKVLDIQDIGYYDNGHIDLGGFYTVTGVTEDIPENSHFHFDFFASMLGIEESKKPQWLSGSYATYLLLDKSAEPEVLESKLPRIVSKHMSGQMEQALGMNFDEFLSSGNSLSFLLQPLREIHLYSDFKGVGEFEAGGDIKMVYIFGAIALFMLLIACVNFMNLSTAGASKRLKEIGMRKVLGSDKKQLIFQFLSESFISTLVAMLLGLLIMKLALPYFNELAGKALEIKSLMIPQVLLSFVLLTLLVSLLAGGYPAFFMSSFKPIESLKKRFSVGSSKGVRSSLVVFQFTISACLIIGVLVVNTQMNFIQSKDVGYEREQLIVLRDAGKLGNKLDAYKEELLMDSRIQKISKSAYIPAGPTDTGSQTIEAGENAEFTRRIMEYGIDEEYIETMGMKLVAGRNFSKEYGDETSNVIINETAAKVFGISDEPIGKTFRKLTDLQGGRETITVIGVVKDFNARSLREPIEPLMMSINPYYSLIVKTSTSDLSGLLKSMEEKWVAYGSGNEFKYAFLDELFNETYLKEANMNKVLRVFAMLTIFVACLGLLGLVTFTADQRFKEIGIRKALGSSVVQIVTMLTRDFFKLVSISLLIAFPLGYYLMDMWLQDFEYRINIEWWIFVVAGMTTLLTTFLIISYKSINAALMNPVNSLKNE